MCVFCVSFSRMYSSTKEEVATLVSNNNTCAVCSTAHALMSAAAVNAERKLRSELSDGELETHGQGLAYAEMLQKATHGKGTLLTGAQATDEFPRLNGKARAEVALVVMLFEHMNRACSSIMGEKMSTAMFGIPVPIAKRIESKRVMAVVNRMMAPFLSGGIQKPLKAGFTESLFKDEGDEWKVHFAVAPRICGKCCFRARASCSTLECFDGRSLRVETQGYCHGASSCPSR
jgi:hypothetical protein